MCRGRFLHYSMYFHYSSQMYTTTKVEFSWNSFLRHILSSVIGFTYANFLEARTKRGISIITLFGLFSWLFILKSHKTYRIISHNRWGTCRIVLALTNGQQEYLNLQINFKGDIASPTKYLKDNLCKRITLSTAKPAATLPSHYAMKSRLCFNNQILVWEK